jgi:hypothetical protein
VGTQLVRVTYDMNSTTKSLSLERRRGVRNIWKGDGGSRSRAIPSLGVQFGSARLSGEAGIPHGLAVP